MTAQEMFEELGFTLKPGFMGYIWYEDGKGRFIYFEENTRMYYNHLIFVDTKIHKAINKQCQELGWIE